MNEKQIDPEVEKSLEATFDAIFGDDTEHDQDWISPEVAHRAANMKPNRLVKVRVYDPEDGWITEYVTENDLVDAPAGGGGYTRKTSTGSSELVSRPASKAVAKSVVKAAPKTTYPVFSWQKNSVWGNFLINWQATCGRKQITLAEAIANSINL